MRAGLITDTYVRCTAIERHKKNYSDMVELSDEMENRIDDASSPSSPTSSAPPDPLHIPLASC